MRYPRILGFFVLCDGYIGKLVAYVANVGKLLVNS